MLRYLAYNLQHVRSSDDVYQDRFAHCLAGAAVAAHGRNSGASAALKALLQPLGLRSELHLNPSKSTSVYVDEFIKLITPPNAFLGTPSNFDRLAEFILLADGQVWKVFLENRANLARYLKLLAFYTALLG